MGPKTFQVCSRLKPPNLLSYLVKGPPFLFQGTTYTYRQVEKLVSRQQQVYCFAAFHF